MLADQALSSSSVLGRYIWVDTAADVTQIRGESEETQENPEEAQEPAAKKSKVKNSKTKMVAITRQTVAKAAGVGMVMSWRVRSRTSAAVDGTKERVGQVVSAAQALVAGDLFGDINRLVAVALKGPPTVYDKAMDANYLDPALRAGLGGSYHRLLMAVIALLERLRQQGELPQTILCCKRRLEQSKRFCVMHLQLGVCR